MYWRLGNRGGVRTVGDTSDILQTWVEFVNSQAAYHQRQLERLSRRAEDSKPNRRLMGNHERIAKQLENLAHFLSSHTIIPKDHNPSSKKGAVSSSLHIIPEDLEGLPKELLDELNISESDELELDIFEALKKAGGTLPVDKIMIQLFRDTGKVHQRKQLAAKLYRMAAKDRLIASQEHRGVYSLPDKQALQETLFDLDQNEGGEEI